MIIKGLFRRYERWNPVHPTAGAFWGMGIGVGCGVGWGPGFGPEVIGYVGAGCGAGFCVGLTLAGIGIGLPANALIEVPCNAAIRGAERAIGCARSMAAINMAGFLAESQEFMDSMTRTALRNGMNSMQPIKSLSRRTQQALQCLNSSMRGPGKSSSASNN